MYRLFPVHSLGTYLSSLLHSSERTQTTKISPVFPTGLQEAESFSLMASLACSREIGYRSRNLETADLTFVTCLPARLPSILDCRVLVFCVSFVT